VFKFEADVRRLASFHGALDVCDPDLPGKNGWRVVGGFGSLDAEMRIAGTEGNEVRLLRAFVDDWQAELFVEGALSGQVRHVQDGGQPDEQARWLLAHARMLPKPA
jgi:hypothetical protein